MQLTVAQSCPTLAISWTVVLPGSSAMGFPGRRCSGKAAIFLFRGSSPDPGIKVTSLALLEPDCLLTVLPGNLGEHLKKKNLFKATNLILCKAKAKGPPRKWRVDGNSLSTLSFLSLSQRKPLNA